MQKLKELIKLSNFQLFASSIEGNIRHPKLRNCWVAKKLMSRTSHVKFGVFRTEFLPSSETQGQLVGAGKRLNGRGKKLGEEKSRKKVGAPGILLLTDQFRNHLKSLPVIGHKNIFCAQSESSSFRVTFVTSYSKVITAKLFARLFAIYLLARAGEFPSIEKRH